MQGTWPRFQSQRVRGVSVGDKTPVHRPESGVPQNGRDQPLQSFVPGAPAF